MSNDYFSRAEAINAEFNVALEKGEVGSFLGYFDKKTVGKQFGILLRPDHNTIFNTRNNILPIFSNDQWFVATRDFPLHCTLVLARQKETVPELTTIVDVFDIFNFYNFCLEITRLNSASCQLEGKELFLSRLCLDKSGNLILLGDMEIHFRGASEILEKAMENVGMWDIIGRKNFFHITLARRLETDSSIYGESFLRQFYELQKKILFEPLKFFTTAPYIGSIWSFLTNRVSFARW